MGKQGGQVSMVSQDRTVEELRMLGHHMNRVESKCSTPE